MPQAVGEVALPIVIKSGIPANAGEVGHRPKEADRFPKRKGSRDHPQDMPSAATPATPPKPSEMAASISSMKCQETPEAGFLSNDKSALARLGLRSKPAQQQLLRPPRAASKISPPRPTGTGTWAATALVQARRKVQARSPDSIFPAAISSANDGRHLHRLRRFKHP